MHFGTRTCSARMAMEVCSTSLRKYIRQVRSITSPLNKPDQGSIGTTPLFKVEEFMQALREGLSTQRPCIVQRHAVFAMGCGCSVHCAIVGHYSPGLKAYIFNKRGVDPKDNQYSRLARKVHRDMKLYIDEAKSGDIRTAKTRQACHARWAQVPGSPPKRTSPHCKYDPAGELHPTA